MNKFIKKYFFLIFVVLIETLIFSYFDKQKYILTNLIISILVALDLYFIIGEKGLITGHAIHQFLAIIITSLTGFIYFKKKLTVRNISGLIFVSSGFYLLDKAYL